VVMIKEENSYTNMKEYLAQLEEDVGISTMKSQEGTNYGKIAIQMEHAM
jgi:hypothetical protein